MRRLLNVNKINPTTFNLRAEYLPKSPTDCFEGVPASYLFYPLFLGGPQGAAMVVGDIGSGKTYLLRLLASETPIEIRQLDKKKLLGEGVISYETLAESQNPMGCVMDDVHILLTAMKLHENKNESEKYVLDLLETFKIESAEKGARPIFVSDSSPSGLVTDFSVDGNKKRFMEILDGCVANSDDTSSFYRILGKKCLEPQRVVDVNARCLITHNSYMKGLPDEDKAVLARLFKEELSIWQACEDWPFPVGRKDFVESLKQDVNFYGKSIEQVQKAADEKIFKWGVDIEKKLESGNFSYGLTSAIEYIANGRNIQTQSSGKKLSAELGMADIPLLYSSRAREQIFPILEGHIDPYNLHINYHGRWEKETPNRCIAPIRQLRVVAHVLGGITREKLGVEDIGVLGTKGWRESIMHTGSEILQIRDRIFRVYQAALGYKSKELAQGLALAITDEDAARFSSAYTIQLGL